MKYDELVVILDNQKVNGEYLKLVFRSKNLSRNIQPGQFLNVQIQPNSFEPFWRRPFSYYRITQDKVEILYKILGRGTELLSKKKKGESLNVMGPLGNPFTPKVKNKKRVLIAGGVGVPPLVFLAERYPMNYVLIGARTKSHVLPKKELSKVKAEIHYSTDDGSYGLKGNVIVLLRNLLKKESPENLFIQTCGPKGMMQAVLDMARQHHIEGEASVDETMSCGMGVCLGCMVKTHQGWTPSCIEGPVFNFEKLVSFS